jgi:hypothetical protein
LLTRLVLARERSKAAGLTVGASIGAAGKQQWFGPVAGLAG